MLIELTPPVGPGEVQNVRFASERECGGRWYFTQDEQPELWDTLLKLEGLAQRILDDYRTEN